MPMPKRRGTLPVGPNLAPERSRGALLGLAVGDAFGTTIEGRRTFAPQFPELALGPHVDIRGLGPHELKAGQVTDDTQMATCLAASLTELTVFNPEDVRKRYVKWLDSAFTVDPYVKEVLTTSPGHQASRMVWHQSGRRAHNNASLARTAPLAVFYAKNEDERLRVSLEECALTHFDPRCQLACAAFNHALAAAINARGVVKPEDVMLEAESAIALGSSRLARSFPELVQEIHLAADNLRADLLMARKPDPQLYGPELHLHTRPDDVRVPFRLALWEMLHARSFEEGMLDVVNRGGDSDTNGAIAGGLLGALYGEDAIPERWRERVLGSLANVPGPLRDRYHPNQLMTLIGAS